MKKIMKLIIGLSILSLGIALLIKANLGADPVTILITGLSLITNLSIGRASQVLMIALILVVFILDKRRLGIGTLVHALLVGVLLDFFLKYTFELPFVIEYGLGLLLMCLGIAVYISVELGEGAIDSIMMLIVKRFKLSMKQVRILMDASFVALGVLMGARLGIGSVIAVLVSGPLIQGFHQRIRR